MVRNTTYKQVCRITLTGDDIVSLSTYKIGTSQAINGVRMRFNLNGALNHLKLSSNARAVVETCNVQTIGNMGGKYILLRLATSTNDACFDTKYFLSGNPIILSMPTAVATGTNNFVFNCSEFFYNVNIPTNFLQNGYIDLQLECPTQINNGYDILYTVNNLNAFFVTFIISDEDLEITQDNLLAPKDANNYHPVQMPIRFA